VAPAARPLSEFGLIARHFRREAHDPALVAGIGDDAAVVRVAPGHELVLAVDMMVESRHFLPDVDPASLGHKVLAVNLSDLAAMGARPRWALLAGALPDSDEAWIAAFCRGLFALADEHGVTLIGGDTTRGPRTLSLTIAGEVPAGESVRRGGAQPGDDVWISGRLGDSMLALSALQGRTKLAGAELVELRARLEWPVPRVGLGIALRGIASAMIDVSDGLTGDLRHILDASRVGARIALESLPRSGALDRRLEGSERALALACLLAGGDDYELCFTAPPYRRSAVQSAATRAAVAVARVGGIVGDAGVLVVLDEAHAPIDPLPRAFDHFGEPARPRST
jgi:thiamine-monophosphate kinase